MIKKSWLGYFLTLLLLTVADRCSKLFAVKAFVIPYKVTNFLSFELVFNRGISWGLFGSESDIVFAVVNLVIIFFLIFFVVYMKQRYQHKQSVFAELLVMCGALSNVCDRFYYQGVIDFIVLSLNSWSWPVFNLADVFIVIGIGVMFFRGHKS